MAWGYIVYSIFQTPLGLRSIHLNFMYYWSIDQYIIPLNGEFWAHSCTSGFFISKQQKYLKKALMSQDCFTMVLLFYHCQPLSDAFLKWFIRYFSNNGWILSCRLLFIYGLGVLLVHNVHVLDPVGFGSIHVNYISNCQYIMSINSKPWTKLGSAHSWTHLLITPISYTCIYIVHLYIMLTYFFTTSCIQIILIEFLFNLRHIDQSMSNLQSLIKLKLWKLAN